jgi:hypothetical protein
MVAKIFETQRFETRGANVLKHEDAKAQRHEGFETQRREGTKTRSFFIKHRR